MNLEQKIEQLNKDCKALREAVDTMLDAGAKEKTILILLSHYTKLPQKTIKAVMIGLHNLEHEYFGEEE